MLAPNEVFLSHSHADHALLLRLSAELTRHGVPHWFAEREILGAQQWHDEIGAALQRCDWFAVLVSPAAVESAWVPEDLTYALRQPRYLGHIVPVIGAEAEMDRLSWTLGNRQSVSLLPNFDDGVRDLLRIWGIGYRG